MNFIIFVPDELRAESIACYGHPLIRTPNIDRLAAEGVRFDQAHVQHTVCTPSRCSFMTGWYPHVRGHRSLWHMLRPDEPNLLKYLKKAGYEVAWFGRNDLLAEAAFKDSVDIVCDPAAGHQQNAGRSFGPDQAGFQSFLNEPGEGAIDELEDMRRVGAGIEYLNRPHDKPFVLYLPLSLPHCPYSICQPYYDMYAPADLPPLRPSQTRGKSPAYDLIRRYRRLDDLDPSVLRKINAVYLGMITGVDEILGRLLQTLDQSGLAGETTVIFFADHGDWAGDYGLVEKWPNALDDCLTRVPLIVRLPEGSAGHVVSEPVEVMDIMATVLELAGIEATHTHFSRSLVPQLHGRRGDSNRAVFAEGGYDLHEPHCFEGRPQANSAIFSPESIYYLKGLQQQQDPQSVCRSTMIRTAKHKLVRRTDARHELYDLQADPQELCNVYDRPEYAGIRVQLEQQMLEWLIRTSDVTPFDEDPRKTPDGLPNA